MFKYSSKLFFLTVFISGCAAPQTNNLQISNASLQQYQQVQKSCTCQSAKPKSATGKTTDTVKNPVKNSVLNTETTPEKKPEKAPVSTATSKIETKVKKSPLEFLIEKIKDADSKILISQIDMYTFSKGDYKDGRRTGETKETFVTGKMTVKKPSTIMININDSDSVMAKGSSLLYTGVGKVKVKAGGVLSIIPVSYDIDDPTLTNARNQKLMDLNEHIKRLTSPGAELKLLGTSTVSDRKVYMIRNEKPKISDTEITHEIFAIDAENFALMSNEMYINDKMVSQYLIKKLVLNPKLEDDFFNL